MHLWHGTAVIHQDGEVTHAVGEVLPQSPGVVVTGLTITTLGAIAVLVASTRWRPR